MKNKSIVFSVTMHKGCYRHIQINSSSTLYDLHSAILDAFDFDDDHLHVFFMSNRAWDEDNGIYSHYCEDEEHHSNEYKLSDFNFSKGSQFLYIFDFGDDWRFHIKVLRTDDAHTGFPTVIKEVGEAPEQYPDCDDFDDEEDDALTVHKPFVSMDEVVQPLGGQALERAELLNRYATSAINLYGIITQDDFVRIFNEQNDDKTNVDEVFQTLLRFITIENTFYCFYEEYIVHMLFEDNDFEDISALEKQIATKPRFIPTKDEFLKYEDEDYVDNPIYFAKLRKFLENIFGETVSVLNAYDHIKYACAHDFSTNEILALLEEYDLVFEGIEQISLFMNLIAEAQNNCRLWVNKGYTPIELTSLYKQQPVKSRKTGRNEPCPCGSGKKYKKCCGK